MPFFSVVTTAKNEEKKMIEEVFQNWELTKEVFERKRDKKVEFIVVDAGNDSEIPKLKDSFIVSEKTYQTYRKFLYSSGKIKYKSWDSPSIGRNLGFKYCKGKIIVFQDIDTLFSTGTELDFNYINPKLDKYENYFDVMYKAFKEKPIVAASPSARACDVKKISRRFGMMGENYIVQLSCKLPTLKIGNNFVIGPSIPGFSIVALKDVCDKIYEEKGFLFDPELAIAEDHKFSRMLGVYGKISYERRAGVFTRTVKRVSPGFDLLKSLLYATKWVLPYFYPDFFKYKKHVLSV
ncbi:MAG: glycosyltransferase family A protein [Candidatus Aenigmatarchaeota archaeon]